MSKRTVLLACSVFALVALSLLLKIGGDDVSSPLPRGDQGGTATSTSELPQLATAADTPAREELGADQTQAPLASAPEIALPPAQARLDVRLVARETNTAIAGVHVWVWPIAPIEGFEVRTIDRANGRPGGKPRTDKEGWVSLALPPDTKFVIDTHGQPGHGPARAEVKALRPGERRELVLEAETGDNARFFGRLLTDENGEPIAQARVWLHRESFSLYGGPKLQPSGVLPEHAKKADALASSDEEGFFELRFASWDVPIAQIDASGRSLLVTDLPTGHETRETAMEIRLVRAGALAARVIDTAGRPVEGISVRASAEASAVLRDARTGRSGNAPAWQETTSEDGRALLVDLPAKTPLVIELVREVELLRREAEPLVLALGEERALDLVFGRGATLRGRLVDERDTGVADHEVWLARRGPGDPDLFFENDTIDSRARTDVEGKFIFTDLAPGEWRVGPAAVYLNDQRADPLAGLVAPVAVRFEVEADTRELDLVVRTQRALGIRGQVLDPDGRGIRSFVVAERPGWSSGASTDAEGFFVVGPLLPGEYEVVARWNGPSSALAPSDPLTARAGEQDLVLRMLPGSRIEGRVIDGASGEPCAASVSWSRLGEREVAPRSTSTGNDGTFATLGLQAGSYSVFASTQDGRCSEPEAVELALGQPATVTLEVSLGATLALRCESPKDARRVFVRRGEAALATGVIQSGASLELTLPAGKVEVTTLGDERTPSFEGAFVLVAGKRHAVVLPARP